MLLYPLLVDNIILYFLTFWEKSSKVYNCEKKRRNDTAMNKDKETRRIHYAMAVMGGFFGGFAILMHHNLLSNAQTSNMMSLVIGILGRNPWQVLLHAGSLVIYMLGLSLTVLLPRYTKWKLPLCSVVLDGVALVAIALMPEGTDDFVAMYPIFLAMAFQWNTFTGADGYVSSTIFSTNNLRQFTTSLVGYLCDRNGHHIHKASFFGGTLLFFHVGVSVAFFSTQLLGKKGGFCGYIPLLTAMILIQRECRKCR